MIHHVLMRPWMASWLSTSKYIHWQSVWKALIYSTRLDDVSRALNEDSSGDTTRLVQCHSYLHTESQSSINVPSVVWATCAGPKFKLSEEDKLLVKRNQRLNDKNIKLWPRRSEYCHDQCIKKLIRTRTDMELWPSGYSFPHIIATV